MRKLLLTITLSLTFFIIGTTTVQAKILDKEHNRTYQLTSDHVRVTETLSAVITDARYMVPAGSEEVFTIFNPVLNDPEAEEKIAKTLETIKIVDSSGNQMPYQHKIDGQNIVIVVKYGSNLLYNQKQTITLTYDSYALLYHSGAIYDFYPPSFSTDFEPGGDNFNLQINTKIFIPKSLGDINFAIPAKQPRDNGDNWEYNFSLSELTGVISWVQIGTTQYYHFSINQPYKATTDVPLFHNTYVLPLPTDIDAGSITQHIEYTEISPDPDTITRDDDGNLVAYFLLPANESGNIKIAGYATVAENHTFDPTDSGSVEEITSDMRTEYTHAAPFWEVNAPLIQTAAAEIQDSETDVYKLIAKTYKYVVDQIDYSEVKRFGIIIPNERQGALNTLQGGAAVCMEYSDLFIALMRAQGIPARAAFGYGYDARATGGDDIAHQWAEVYLPSQGTWIGVDTTWGENGPAIIGGDLNHFYKYVASESPNDPAPVEVSYFGSLDKVPDEVFEITALEGLPADGVPTFTASDLLTKFQPKSDVEQHVGNLTRAAELATSTLDHQLSSLLTSQFGVSDQYLQTAKIMIYLAPVLIVILLFIYIKLNRTKRSEAKKNKLSEVSTTRKSSLSSSKQMPKI